MQTPIATRDRARDLRRRLTQTELWMWLRIRRDPVARFRKQHPMGPYILDFYCPSAKLAVELDGGAHNDEDRRVHDAIRTRWLESQGLRLLRIELKEFLADPDAVALHVLETARAAVGRF